MKLSMNLLELWVRDVCVYLGSRNGGMSEEFLNRSYISTVREQGSGEAVT